MRRSDNAVRFSHAWIDSLPRPAVRREWADADCDGLCLRLGTSGSRVFYLFARLNGRLTRIRLGEYPTMPLAEARREVRALLGKAAVGEPVRTRAAVVRDEWTLGRLWEWYLRTHSRVHKRTWQTDQARYERVLKPWHSKQLSEITRAMVKDLHVKLGAQTPGRDKNGRKQGGTYAANKMLELLGHMWRLGQSEIGFTAPDPTRGLKRFPTAERERFLTQDELPRFFEALAQHPKETTRHFILMALLTGARRSNVAAMRWDQVDFTKFEWKIPAEQSKNKRPMLLPLAPAAIELLRARQQLRLPGPWVFPGGGRTGHLVEPKHAWQEIVKRAELKDIVFHDLRRTLGSWQAMLGASLPIIGRSLGHSTTEATRVYARLQNDPVRESIETAIAEILKQASLPAGLASEGAEWEDEGRVEEPERKKKARRQDRQ